MENKIWWRKIVIVYKGVILLFGIAMLVKELVKVLSDEKHGKELD